MVPGRRAERDDGAALPHALGHGAAGQRDGGDGRGDHRGVSLARTMYTAQPRRDPSCVARDRELPADDGRLLVEDPDCALHRDRPEAADAGVVRVVEEPEEQQRRRDHDRHAAHHRRLHDGALGAVGEEQHEHEDDRRAEQQHDPQRHRDHPLGAVGAVGARVLAVGALVEPLRVRRLLGGGPRLDGPERAERGDTPWIDRVAEGARLHLRPLLVDHRPRVADELAGEARANGDREELRRLELLRHDLRLRLGAATRGVEALEREEDDEPEEHGEPGREHAEDAGGAVAVLEVASRRSSAANEQHRRDRKRRDDHDDEACPEQVHEVLTENPGSARHAVADTGARPTTGP